MYKRVILKLSGEALAGNSSQYDPIIINQLCQQIKILNSQNVEIGIIVGGGNIMRGKTSNDPLDRVAKDYMGMLATVINALAIQGYLEQMDVATRVMTAIEMRAVAEPYILRRAIRHLEKGRVVIFGAGTGLPYFSTDTLAALRASELKADVILMAKNGVDGVYDKDPNLYPDAKKFDTLSYIDVINKNLQVMDTTAISMCMENNIDLVVFNIHEKDSIIKAANQIISGTIINKGE